uniref:Serine/threonine-protein kinase ULK4 n=1 Tax=Anthurium amnicola TaxID=1678845 RepID=A0A1D1ZBD0_9ARAE
MNNYHIYEAIGRGKHSVVYKGRKKKTIEYYAVKSVDKSQRSKVLRAGKMLHKLDHPNILRFYNWYETSGHLWLILEYCVGGNLMNLLGQDKQLPEDAIHDLARDLVTALQFLHSKGILYCDLKPSNILLDENGLIKLCDFGSARYVTDVSANSLPTLSQGKTGTPCYMAPELFQDGGVHSYASDFWALGCVLYECYTSRPPFEGKEFTQLVKSIISDPMTPLSGNPSSTFVDLVSCLLQKDPATRIKWPALCGHCFWRTKFKQVPLPPQPAFADMIQISARLFLSERNGDGHVQQGTPSKFHGRDSNGVQKLDETCSSGIKSSTTPVKNSPSGRKPHSKTSGRVDDRQRGPSNAIGVNLLRLSRMAKLNLQRDNEKENYRRPLQKNSENDGEVHIENNDMELDFSEIQEDDASDEVEMPATTTAEILSNENGVHERTEVTDQNLKLPDINVEVNITVFDDVKTVEHDMRSENNEVTATPPSSCIQRKAPRSKPASEGVPDSNSANSSDDLSRVFWHSSDLSVRPIMLNKKPDKTSDAMPVLTFEVLPACDYAKLSSEQLETYNNQIILSLSGNGQVSEKQNVIRYVEMLSGNSDAANLITNGPVMLLLVKMLRLPKASALRIQLASVIGLLIRHSTFIQVELATSGIIIALTNGLRDKQEKVRRFSMAALGELLFYISTLNDHNKDGNVLESPSKDNRSICGWQVSTSVIALVSSVLRRGEDDLTQLYALRTIENICSQGGDWASRFTSQDTIGNICYIYKATGKQESTKLTAGSCLVRLARFNPQSITLIFERLSFKETASVVIKGSPREQQISLNLLNMAMLQSHLFTNMGRHLISLVEEKLLVPGLVILMEQGTEVLRGKALIFVALLCKNSRRWLPPFFCNAKVLPLVDRLAKEKDGFVQKCMEAFLQVIIFTVPEILGNVSADVQQIIGGKRHVSSITSRGNLKSTSHLFLVVLHLLGSSSFKQRLVTSQILVQLANLIKLMESPFQGRDDFQMTLLHILEAVIEEASIIQNEARVFTNQILPSLAMLYRGNKDDDARFLCLKILFDAMVVFLNEMSDTSTADCETMKDLKSLSETYFLPLYPIMIQDEDPIPMYAQKILVMLIEYKCVKVSDILDLRTVSQCFEFLLGDLSGVNVNDVKLCLALTSAPEMDTKILCQLRVVRKIGNLLEFVNARGMEDFLMPTLGLCKAFISHDVGCKRALAYCNEPAILTNAAMDANVLDQQHCIKDIADLSCYIGVFLELIGYSDQQVADLASECMALLLKIAPKEATMGLLTNLPKICHVLESWREGVSSLLVVRILYSLAFSCRQYLSQALILSVPQADIMRIEVTVSTLKCSSAPSVANAASILFLELQRLPRHI